MINITLVKKLSVKENGKLVHKNCVSFCSYKKYPFYLSLFHPEKPDEIEDKDSKFKKTKIYQATLKFIK